MEHRRGLYAGMLLCETLNDHLVEINQACLERIDTLARQMAVQQDVTEGLKARDQMAWVRRMNRIRHAAEELALDDLVYC